MLSLYLLERKQKNSSNPFRVRILLFLSYSSGTETMNTFIHSCSSLKNHTRFQTKTGAKIPTRWARTYLYSLYKGVSPGSSLALFVLKRIQRRFFETLLPFWLKIVIVFLDFQF